MTNILSCFSTTPIADNIFLIAAYIIPQTRQKHSHVELPCRIVTKRLVYFLKLFSRASKSHLQYLNNKFCLCNFSISQRLISTNCPSSKLHVTNCRNIATGETSPAITPYHTYHFSISTSLTFITNKLLSQDDFHHLITFTTR